MAITTETRCDICGALKRSENHWWALRFLAGVAQLRPLWLSRENAFEPAAEFVLCGEVCVGKKISEWMSAQAR